MLHIQIPPTPLTRGEKDYICYNYLGKRYYTKSGSHTPLIYIALNCCKKKIWTIFIKGFWQADLVLGKDWLSLLFLSLESLASVFSGNISC
jgi:hypothetical protein